MGEHITPFLGLKSKDFDPKKGATKQSAVESILWFA